MFTPQKIKSAADKLLPISVAVTTAYFIDSYADFLHRYGNVGLVSLIVTLLMFVILWDWLTGLLVRHLQRSPARNFLGTWRDVAWSESFGELVPSETEIEGGAWIHVSEKDGAVLVSGYLFTRDSLARGHHVGRFQSVAIYVDASVLKFEYTGGAGLTSPPGFGWYNCIVPKHGQRDPLEWRGHFFRKGQQAQFSKARRVTVQELKCVKSEADMARLISQHLKEVCALPAGVSLNDPASSSS